MSVHPRIVFIVGGAYHPTEEQAAAVARWLGDGYDCVPASGRDAFEELQDADLLVLMGTHFSGMTQASLGGLQYLSPTADQRSAFKRYVSAGKPLLLNHGCILSYDDWPEFGDLIGFRWDWTNTKITPLHEMLVRIKPTGHPVVAGVEHFIITDELYVDIQVMPGFSPIVHAGVHIDDEGVSMNNGQIPTRIVPLVLTGEGGRVPGAGKVAYLVNGHDMQAFSNDGFRQLWLNAVGWLLET